MRAKSGPAPSEHARHADTPRPASNAGQASGSTALAAARRGDLAAWHQVVREQQELVFRSAYLATRDSALAEEATKSAFIRAYRSLPSLADGSDVRPWLMRLTDSIARGQLREVAQRRDARAPVEDRCPRLAATPAHLAPGTPTPTPLDYTTLADAFEGLADNERVIIAARYTFGLGRDAAAARLGAEPDAVDGALAAAVSRLRLRASATTSGAEGPAPVEPHPTGSVEDSRFRLLSDDQLGSMTMAAVMSELSWTPDVAPVVCDRLAREAVAYGVRLAVSGSSSRPVEGSAPALQASTRHSSSRGLPVLRSLGIVAGLSLLVVAFVVAGGRASRPEADVLADVGSSNEAMLAGPAAPPMAAASPMAVASGAGPLTRALPTEPAGLIDGPAEVSVVPATSEPVASLVGARRLGDGSLRAGVRLDWPPTGAGGAPVRARLEQRIDEGAWSPLAWTDGQEPLIVEIGSGATYDLRARMVEASGVETVSPVSRLKLVIRTPRSDRLVRSKGDWATKRVAPGQKRLVALVPGARVRTEFRGIDVAILGRLSRAPDSIRLRIDGRPWIRDPEPIARSGRKVLLREAVDDGRHTLDVRALADGLAVDAILILRSVAA